MSEIAVGVTVFQREQKVSALLNSIREIPCIDSVYIGDNGKLTPGKKQIYEADYPFELHILDLAYDSGLGYGRREIVNESSEPYLLIVDNDVHVPHNVKQLFRILEQRPNIGGAGGILIESDRIRSDCYDLFNKGRILLKDIQDSKAIQKVGGLPVVSFDQIQNVAMYRRECLEDYCWDPAYTIGWEHTDFFYGHKAHTEWSFCVCPEVMFRHFPGGDDNYLLDRRSYQRINKSKQYFLQKWGFSQVLNGQTRWLESHGQIQSINFLGTELLKHGLMKLPTILQVPLMNGRDFIRRIKGKPPF